MALIDVEQVQETLGIPQSTAYRIIKELNLELSKKGFYTIRGKIEETYLLKRFGMVNEMELPHGTQTAHN